MQIAVRWWMYGLVCLWALWGVPTLAQQQDALSQTADALVKQFVTMAEKRNVPAGETMVIAEFSNINCRGDAIPRIVQERLITAFIMEEKAFFNIVERTQLDKAMKELKMDLSGLTDPDMQKQIGKLLGAKYILLGSISEAQGLLTIEGRIVAIENGQSKAAARQSINNMASAPTGTPVATPTPATPDKPVIDTTQNARTTGEGTYLGQRENAGLTPGTRFKQAWQEKLGVSNAVAFAVGDVLGEGKNSVALATFNKISITSYIYHDLSLWQWNDTKFRSISQESAEFNAGLTSNALNYPRLSIVKSQTKTYLYFSPTRDSWGGYESSTFPEVFDVAEKKWKTNPVGQGDFSGPLIAPPPHFQPSLLLLQKNVLLEGKKMSTNITEFRNVGCYAAGDIDDDGQVEVAVTTAVIDEKDKKKITPGPIKVLSLSAAEEYVTPKAYGLMSTLWKPKGTKVPYLVVTNSGLDAAGKPEKGAYLTLLQWNDEEYVEIWRSDLFGEKILDLQVCDPKNEGSEGLVVLSQDKGRCYLTKIVTD